MSWKEKMAEWGGGEVSFLSVDGECVTFVVVGEPVLITGKYKGKETQRVGCPIVTRDGFTLLIVGKRIARRITKYEPNFGTQAFDLIRHGEQGDNDTSYELKLCDQKTITKELFAIVAQGISQSDVDDAIEAAREIATS